MKRIVKSTITAASETTAEERLDAALKTVNEDFEYAVMGIEHLGRQGANATSEALKILENLQACVASVLSQIADTDDVTSLSE